VFHDVMDGALRLMDVAPDDLDAWLAVQAEAESKRHPPVAQALAGDDVVANSLTVNSTSANRVPATAPLTGAQGGVQ
jgi:cell division protein FtsI (penicillin-binding protein 3)